MKIDLSSKVVGDIFQILNDKRWFRVFEIKKFNELENIKFYAYGFRADGDKWILDEDQTNYLIDVFNIDVEYCRIVHTPLDNIFMNVDTRKYWNFYEKRGCRYIAECKMNIIENWTDNKDGNINITKSIIRDASAGADNIGIYFVTYAPEIAMSRAKKRCIIDFLKLKDIVSDYIDTINYEKEKLSEDSSSVEIKQENKKDNKLDNNNLITETQMNMIKLLLKANKKKFLKKKYKKMTQEEAGKIIEELKAIEG